MKNKNRYVLSIVAVIIGMTACSKWDDYKKYTATGEVRYTGKLDSVKVYSGKERVKIYGVLPADQGIEKLKITWNAKADSVVYNITKAMGNEVFEQIFSVDEGLKNFQVETFDAAGNASVVVNATGTSYGNLYRRKISNRPILSVVYSAGNSTINWDAIDLSAGAQYMEVRFDLSGTEQTVTTPVSQPTTVLTGFDYRNTSFRYRTIYRPDSTSIDTFSTSFTTR